MVKNRDEYEQIQRQIEILDEDEVGVDDEVEDDFYNIKAISNQSTYFRTCGSITFVHLLCITARV